MLNSGMTLGILGILSGTVALYSAFVENISYDNPLSCAGLIAIGLGFAAFRIGSRRLGLIGIIAGIPSTLLFLFLFLFFTLGGSR